MKKTRYICKHCNHTWVPRRQNPKRCPNCKRTNWGKRSEPPRALEPGDDSVIPGVFQG